MRDYLEVTLGEHCPSELRQAEQSRLEEFKVIFRDILQEAQITSVVEFGAGMMAHAIRAVADIYPAAHTTAVDIDKGAMEILQEAVDEVIVTSVCEVSLDKHDLVISNGLLSCLDSYELPAAYATLVNTTSKWLWIKDYYAPQPTKLWHPHASLTARDWCREILETDSDLSLGRFTEEWWLFSRAN